MEYLGLVLLFAIASLLYFSLKPLIRMFRSVMGKGENSKRAKKINERFNVFSDEFTKKEDKFVAIKDANNTRVHFKVFPFYTSFEELIDIVPNKKRDLLTDKSKHFSEITLQYLEGIISNSLSGKFGYTDDDIYNILVEFTENAYLFYLDIFVSDLIPKIINENPNQDVCDVYVHKFNEALRDNYISYFQRQKSQSDDQNQYGDFSFDIEKDNKELEEAYNTLGVKMNAPEEEIKNAYRSLAKQYHPDKNKDPKAKETMAEINSAFTLIQEKKGFK